MLSNIRIPPPLVSLVGLTVTLACLSSPAAAQPVTPSWTLFPAEPLFVTPLADQKQPRTHITWQEYERGDQDIPIASVGYGMEWELAERSLGSSTLQVGVNGSVFAIFNLDSPSTDLINADYFVGVPIDFRRGAWSARIRPFHLSSHLGDEFLLYPQPRDPVERVNVSFEAVEALLSWESGPWRLYGGGFSVFHATHALHEDRLQWGLEFRGNRSRRAGARFIAAIDAQKSDATPRADVSAKGGIELVPPSKGRGMQFLLEYYEGGAPHGQFAVEEEVRYLGAGIVFIF